MKFKYRLLAKSHFDFLSLPISITINDTQIEWETEPQLVMYITVPGIPIEYGQSGQIKEHNNEAIAVAA